MQPVTLLLKETKAMQAEITKLVSRHQRNKREATKAIGKRFRC